MIELMSSQLTDIFRIGLIVALVVTMRRTAAVTGRVLPLALGVVFVAVILPTTLPRGTTTFGDAVVAGLVSNAILLLLVLGAAKLFDRFRR